MSKILSEVLEANARYSADFGAKADLALPPARGFAILTGGALVAGREMGDFPFCVVRRFHNPSGDLA